MNGWGAVVIVVTLGLFGILILAVDALNNWKDGL